MSSPRATKIIGTALRLRSRRSHALLQTQFAKTYVRKIDKNRKNQTGLPMDNKRYNQNTQTCLNLIHTCKEKRALLSESDVRNC
uniref:Uncharacterized protein n=1 Tax=Romanomermis culicivorax TaxID=13658 RepID=A0A915L4C2_ROMCU